MPKPCHPCELLARIQIEIHPLNALIESLLNLTRQESGASRLVMRKLDLVKILDRVVADADYEYSREGKRVHLEAATRVTVSGDESALLTPEQREQAQQAFHKHQRLRSVAIARKNPSLAGRLLTKKAPSS